LYCVPGRKDREEDHRGGMVFHAVTVPGQRGDPKSCRILFRPETSLGVNCQLIRDTYECRFVCQLIHDSAQPIQQWEAGLVPEVCTSDEQCVGVGLWETVSSTPRGSAVPFGGPRTQIHACIASGDESFR
jgi:hypothetical protein